MRNIAKYNKQILLDGSDEDMITDAAIDHCKGPSSQQSVSGFQIY